MSLRSTLLAAGLAIPAIFAVSPAASAATNRIHDISAVAVCSGPLPVYDANLKRRPLGILNQGTESVFISCSVPADTVTDQTSTNIAVSFMNFGTVDATVNCTMNAGSRWNYSAGSVGASTTAHVGVNNDYVLWTSIDRKSMWGSFNFSCVLPPNVEIGMIEYNESDSGNGL